MFEQEMDVARQAAESAGALLVELYGNDIHIRKKGRVDLVTDADVQAEDLIVKTIAAHFPSDGVLAEESGRYHSDSGRIWLIDPLDGTTNYAHGFPLFAVSIALEIEGRLELGVVSCPVMREVFEARRGSGARLNGHPVRVAGTARLSEALLGTGFPYNLREDPELHIDRFARMVLSAQGVRRPGSAAIDLCYVAAGRFDGFWEVGLKPWDTAAGVLMVEEAGGLVTTLQGEPFTPYAESVVAANPVLHHEMVALFQRES
ncbi:Inositol-1-monophosphatase [uncultured Desulfatiglans sp.]|nr:Inositol-1-monophosphatase [uncultured Desulfatiglans sp.]